MRRLLVMLLSMLPLAAIAADNWRTFTDKDGRTMEAKILRVESNAVVVELKASGKQLPIEFAKLSEADVEFLSNYSPPGAGGGGEGAADDEDGDSSGEVTKNRLYPRTKAEIQDGIREIKRRPKPSNVSKEVHEATVMLNIYRFLCGVPYDVQPDPEFSKRAEEAALACKKHGGLSHSLGHSTDKCNLSSIGNMIISVPQYIEDAGANNRDVRGHREWCLNPPMGKVGFGSAGASYSAMWCMDGSGKPKDVSDLKVEVFRLSKRPDKAPPSSGPVDGREVKVNYVSLGMGGINFEPEDPAKRGIYWVRVKGGGVNECYLVELY